MRNLVIAAGTMLVLSVVCSEEAFARHRHSGHRHGGYASPGLSVSIGYGGYGGYRGNSGFFGNYSNYGSGYSGHYNAPVYQGYNQGIWHDTSHYDYHGPSVVPHGNHYDYVPGHYHMHQTGHWD